MGGTDKDHRLENDKDHRLEACATRRQTGVVKWFDAKKGIGFIQRVGAPDVFVHFSKIISAVRSFEKGEAVEFTVKPGPRGPAAVDVIRL